MPEPLSTLPATTHQTQMFFLQQMQPDSPFYNVAVRVDLDGELDADRLADCLRLLVHRHRSLRTGFRLDPDGTVRPVTATATSWDVGRRETGDGADDLLRELATRPFDITEPPLIAAHLIRTGPRHHVLALIVHHAVIDAWSVGVLFDELATLYNAPGRPSAAVLPPPAAYPAAERTEAADADLGYWRRRFADLPAGQDRPDRMHRDTVAGGLHHFRIDAGTTEALNRAARGYRCTPFVLMLTALRLAMGRIRGVHDLTIGCPVADRSDPGVEHTVGYLVGTLPIRTVVTDLDDITTAVETVREALLDGFDHRGVSLDRIVAQVAPARDAVDGPLFDITCQLQNVGDERLRLHGVRSTFTHIDKGTAQFPLSLDIIAADGGLNCMLEYSTELFEPAGITEVATAIETAMRRIAGHPPEPGHPAGATPDIAGRLATRITTALRDAPPDHLALVTEERVWTYGHLRTAVEEAATGLRAAGLRPGHRLAVAAPRGADAIVLMLAAWSAGAAYCPLDERMGREQTATVVRRLRPALLLGPAAEDHRAETTGVTPARDTPPLGYVVHTSGEAIDKKKKKHSDLTLPTLLSRPLHHAHPFSIFHPQLCNQSSSFV